MKKILLLFLPVCMLIMAAQTKPKPKSSVPSKTTMANGKKVFDAQCLVCHQADGGGVPRMNPPLVNTSYVKGSKTKLIQIVLKGMNEEGDIDGQSYSNVMAPHPELTDQEIADVLTFVRNSFGNKGSVVTTAEVKLERSKLKGGK